MDTVDDSNASHDLMGLLSSLLYLRSEALDAGLLQTSEALQKCCNSFFVDIKKISYVHRDLEPVERLINAVDKMSRSDLKHLARIIQASTPLNDNIKML